MGKGKWDNAILFSATTSRRSHRNEIVCYGLKKKEDNVKMEISVSLSDRRLNQNLRYDIALLCSSFMTIYIHIKCLETQEVTYKLNLFLCLKLCYLLHP